MSRSVMAAEWMVMLDMLAEHSPLAASTLSFSNNYISNDILQRSG